MLANKELLSNECVELSRQFIKDFYNQDTNKYFDLIDDNFMWVGAFEFMYIYGKEKDSWTLLHIHSSHARDIPLEFDSVYQTPNINEYTSWFQYLRAIDFNDTKDKRIQF